MAYKLNKFNFASPRTFILFALIVFLFALYHFIFTPKTYYVPRAQHDKALHQTWSKKYKGYENWWDGRQYCTLDEDEERRDVKKDLRYREDGSFRIAVFTDLHFSCGHKCGTDRASQQLVDAVLEMERPDLVVFTGDLIQSEGGKEKKNILLDVFAPVERRGIPFTVIFGNHDSDGPDSLTREMLVKVVNRCPHSLTMSPQEFKKNHGNYFRTIKGETNTRLVFLETNRDSMTASQVSWLRDTVADLHNDDLSILASLVFMRCEDIPSKEFVSRMCGRDTVCNGLYGEKTEYGGKDEDTGFYEVFSKMQGRVRAIIAGHDHKNDLCSVSSPLRSSSLSSPNHEHLSSEVLCYARASGDVRYGGYGEDTLKKGARVVHLNQKTASALTYVVGPTGERDQLVHFVDNPN